MRDPLAWGINKHDKRKNDGTATIFEHTNDYPKDDFDRAIDEVLGDLDDDMVGKLIEISPFPFPKANTPVSPTPNDMHGQIVSALRASPGSGMERCYQNQSISTTTSYCDPCYSLMTSQAKSRDTETARVVLLSKDPEALERPKRSLTAYNIFFQAERKAILANLPCSPMTNGKKSKKKKKSGIGFADLAKTVARKWKTLHPDEKLQFQLLAAEDMKRYESEIAVWKKLEMEREMMIWKRSQAKLDRERRQAELQRGTRHYTTV
eukprot:CAMPEP_0168845166 /NCGR_PEP_ID=MMETSP0727-20121128/9133_1 /TAXON_ID=265536 /ORGANISM="Amphiprora sp., Strain CCMP467" /LENGTH=263 /DNA_ID=CAMNT_0008898873 /DNA_START=111 /DNA_END=902 /DNA_ORIENTATION=-